MHPRRGRRGAGGERLTASFPLLLFLEDLAHLIEQVVEELVRILQAGRGEVGGAGEGRGQGYAAFDVKIKGP